jgi:hypothetical protein
VESVLKYIVQFLVGSDCFANALMAATKRAPILNCISKTGFYKIRPRHKEYYTLISVPMFVRTMQMQFRRKLGLY